MGAKISCNCKEMYTDFKHLKELNRQGIYTPEQIRKEVDLVWLSVVATADVADKEQTKQITMTTVNKLGARGDGLTFDEKAFRLQYKKIDPAGIEKVIKD